MTVAKSLPHLLQKVRKLLIPKLFLSYSCIFHNTTDLQEVHLAFEEYNEKHDRILTQVLQEMENLPPRSRVIMEEVFIHNMKYREVAEKYNVSISTVKTLLGNAVRKLRERLDKEKFAGFLFFFCKKKSFCQIF